MQCQCGLHPHGQLTVSEVLIDSVEDVLEVLLSRGGVEAVGHGAELAVEPAGAGPHEGVLTGQLVEHVLLQEGLHARLQLQGVRNLVLQVTQRVQDCLLHSEILSWGLKVLSQHLEVVR